MKNPKIRLLLACLMLYGILPAVTAQDADTLLKRCASVETDAANLARIPSLQQVRTTSEAAIQDYIRANRSQLRTAADEIITIPVVVHVVHNQLNNKVGGVGNSNISDGQIQSQIDVLNEDYGNMSGYKGFYTDSLGVDTGIRFKLVTIVRTYNEQAQFNPITEADDVAEISPAWFTNRYLNIWVTRLADRYLGTSQFPVVTDITTRTQGLMTTEAEEQAALTDGVLIDFRYFGRNSPAITTSLYNLGRTTTHEVGHWLGLIHIWGDQNCGTDYCEDTPTAFTKNETTDTSCEPVFSQCRGRVTRNMIENYMDYSPDGCMSVFTNDQKERIHAVLALSPRRAKMVEFSRITTENVVVELFPNPVHEYLTSNVFTPGYEPFTVSIYNQKGQKVASDVVNRTYVNVRNFPAGVYFYKVTSGNQTVTKRFVVQ
ncbi:T9SS type A sorting domain-containing protein [Dyadobacter sandarakinus]|uniref:T9SS type A sorting domain-containing protein n=1 Tax=Dyadobacter sandarakinus TaxID=2747268 RepID=A0ABX7I3F5_9BACT|nr:T9SS type A sorting domain-containing protein [Dyadobacter sandarakinus]QRR00428.1 T9SS type A sorting domain-containing protein [Dyadobacter sandarakinus]